MGECEGGVTGEGSFAEPPGGQRTRSQEHGHLVRLLRQRGPLQRSRILVLSWRLRASKYRCYQVRQEGNTRLNTRTKLLEGNTRLNTRNTRNTSGRKEGNTKFSPVSLLLGEREKNEHICSPTRGDRGSNHHWVVWVAPTVRSLHHSQLIVEDFVIVKDLRRCIFITTKGTDIAETGGRGRRERGWRK